MERCIFKYTCADIMSLFPLRKIEVIENSDGGMVMAFNELGERAEIKISANDITNIKKAIMSHPAIFNFKDLEESLSILDGVENSFLFSPYEDKTVELSAVNIWAAWEEDVENYYSFTLKDTEDHLPHKSLEVLQVYEDIAEILLKRGLSKEYFKL